MPRDDDMEEYGEDMGMDSPNRGTPLEQWEEGMVGTCSVCGLQGHVPNQCRRDDDSAACPKCGNDLHFYEEHQGPDGMQVDWFDLTKGWRAGQTGRCNFCGLISRVFKDVERSDGTASCEMCERGTFEFMYGIPDSQYRAPTPKPDYKHEVDGLELNLPRRIEVESLRLILDFLKAGKTVEEILNTVEDTSQRIAQLLVEGKITRHVLHAIKRIENERRWVAHEPLLYTQEELDHLKEFVMLRIPFAGRMKITVPGVHGPIHRWVTPQTFEEIQNGERVLVFDRHYKAIPSSVVTDEPRFDLSRQIWPKCNALLGRGIVRALSVTGEEVDLGNEHTGWDDLPSNEDENTNPEEQE